MKTVKAVLMGEEGRRWFVEPDGTVWVWDPARPNGLGGDTVAFGMPMPTGPDFVALCVVQGPWCSNPKALGDDVRLEFKDSGSAPLETSVEVRPTPKGTWPKIRGEWTSFVGPVCMGNGTQYRMSIVRTKRGLFIGVEGRGAYAFEGFAHKGYVADKLGLKWEGDAGSIADLINYLLGIQTDTAQGEYRPGYCDTGAT